MQNKESWTEEEWEIYESVCPNTQQNTVLQRQGTPVAIPTVTFPQTGSSTGVPLILIGLEAICNAVGAGPRTVKRWVESDGFPARRCSDGVYRADPYSVQRWFSNV